MNFLRKTTGALVEILLLTFKIAGKVNAGHVFALQTNLYGKILGLSVKIPTSKFSLHSARKIFT